MIYPKKIDANSTMKSVEVGFLGGTDTVTEETLLSQGVSKISYNVKGDSGALTETYGIAELTINDQPIQGSMETDAVWFFNLGEDGTRYFMHGLQYGDIIVFNPDDPDASGLSMLDYRTPPEMVRFRLENGDAVLFSHPDGPFGTYQKFGFTKYGEGPCFSSICVHYERMFGVTGKDTILHFSANLDALNWNVSADEGGYIEFADERGKLLRIVSFMDYLYLFRENGITRLSAFADQMDFSAKHIFTTTGNIYPETVAVCGDRMLFMCQDGLYVFNGSDTVKILGKLDNYYVGVDNSHACAAYHNGKYVLALRIDFNDDEFVLCEEREYVNNALLIYDVNDGSYTVLRGMDVCWLIGTVNPCNKLLMCFNGEHRKKIGYLTNDGLILGKALPKSWSGPLTDLGQSLAVKHLKYIVLYTLYDITLVVESDGERKEIQVRGSKKSQKIPVRMSGKLFRVSYKSYAEKMKIARPKLVFTTGSGGV